MSGMPIGRSRGLGDAGGVGGMGAYGGVGVRRRACQMWKKLASQHVGQGTRGLRGMEVWTRCATGGGCMGGGV